MLKVVLPVLVRVMARAALVWISWFPKAKLVGERLTAAAGAAALLVPVPLRLTVWGLPEALSAMLSAAVRVPLAEGLKVTLIVQMSSAAIELPQLLV